MLNILRRKKQPKTEPEVTNKPIPMLRHLKSLTENEAKEILNFCMPDEKTSISEIRFEPEYIRDKTGKIEGTVVSFDGASTGIKYFKDNDANPDRYLIPFSNPKCVLWLYKHDFDVSELMESVCSMYNSDDSFEEKIWQVITDSVDEWNPYTEIVPSMWEDTKTKISEYATDAIKEKFDYWVEYRRESWKKYLEKTIALNMRGCRFFRKKDVKYAYYDGWEWINKNDKRDIGSGACLAGTYPILQSGRFKPVETDVFPNNEYYEYILIPINNE